MKTSALVLSLAWFAVTTLSAQTAATAPASFEPVGVASGYEVVERDAHSRVWARVGYETNALGVLTSRTNTFTELQTGLHYREGDQWLTSEAKIEVLPNNSGAVAARGQHRVIFPLEIKSGLIELAMPNNQWLRSRIWGLSYFVPATGQSVLLAEVKEREGVLVGDNTVVYPDCFTVVRASARYTYTVTGCEQDVVWETAPPPPEAFGLDPMTTRLQVITEFVEAPAPAKSSQSADGLADEALSFGAMRIGAGKCFSVDALGNTTGEVPVAKAWIQMVDQGRSFLVEEVEYESVADQLQALPSAEDYQGASLPHRGTGENVIAGLRSLLPKRYAKAAPQSGNGRMARAPSKSVPGFVMDYLVSLTGQANATLHGDTTYYVSGTVNLTGTTTIEGGAVVKYTNSSAARINFTGPLVCQTSAYRPAVFTSKDDNSVGETISGSNNNPVKSSVNKYLVNGGAQTNTYSYVRLAYAGTALDDAGLKDVWHCQLLNCNLGIYTHDADILLRNVLFVGCSTCVKTTENVNGEHLTVDGCNRFADSKVSDGSVVNSILTAVTTVGSVSLASGSVNLASGSGVYQTVGAGSYYLAASSTNHNAGTTNLNAALLSDLKYRTTYPPVVITNDFAVDTTLAPQAQRDTDQPDLGYHYDPIDYVVSGRTVSANLTLNGGVALGTYGNSSTYGISLGAAGRIISEGTPTCLNWIARYNTVQEQATTNWSNASVAPAIMVGYPTAQGQFRFSGWSVLGGVGDHFNGTLDMTNLSWFTDCQLGGGTFTAYPCAVGLTNCVWDRVCITVYDISQLTQYYLFNNLFRGGTLNYRILNNPTGSQIAQDNLFDQTTITKGPTGGDFTHGNNAYVINANRLTPNGAGDVLLTNNPIYLAGSLGRFYYPTNGGVLSTLLNAGSRTAASAGLYHYTTTTNQVEETNSVVDIGYHYVVGDTNGLPMDSDGGGVPDTKEDTNGNGTVDSGETDWTNASDDFNYLLVPGYLRCEYRVDPWGVDAKDPWTGQQRPRLYWIVTSPRRAEKQVAYQVLVATDTNNLALNWGDMWDSGKIYSDQTIHVEYKGNALQSGQRLWWKVRTWSLQTGLSKWSTNAFFQMGLLTNTDWTARWLTTASSVGDNVSPMYRRAFVQRTNDIKRATVTVSAKGVYELWIDGQRIGTNILAPEWTDYNLRIQYQTFDVTANLMSTNTDGTNHVIGAIVGEGWFHGTTSLEHGTGLYRYTNYVGGLKQLLVQLSIERNDQSVTNITTDSSWKCDVNGPIQFSSIEQGETYDARQEASVADWSTFRYNPQESTYFTAPVTSYTNSPAQMTSQSTDPIQIIETRQPIDMWTNTAGGPNNDKFVRIFDMGQNMAGWCSLSLTNANPTNTQVVLRHCERLKLDSNKRQLRGANVDAGTLVTVGWAADQTETYYILNTNIAQTFKPHFTYHSFRFVEVDAPADIVLGTNSLTGYVIRSSLPITGSFTSSHKDVNQLMTNIMWTLKANVYGIYTLCADRSERYGWFADTDIFSQTACYLMDMSGLYYKTMRDIRDDQWKETYNQGFYYYGAYAIQNPLVGKGVGNISTETGGVMRPWQLYQNYADIRALTEHYLSASNWVSWLSNVWPNGVWKNWEATPTTVGYAYATDGDTFLVPPGWANGLDAHMHPEVLGMCHYARSADILVKLSEVLQLEALSRGDAVGASVYGNNYSSYVDWAGSVRSNFQRNPFGSDPKGYVYTNGSGNITNVGKGAQGDYAHALYFNMVPENQRANCVDKMLNDGDKGIVNYNHHFTGGSATNHLSTGIFATGRAMLELTRNGYNAKAYELLTDYRFPSWLYQITNGGPIYSGIIGTNYGSTTMWERWDGWKSGSDGGYNSDYSSFNQVWNGAVGEWIFKVIGGINPDDCNPGFKNIIIYVQPGGGITNATTAFNSIHGPISTSWTNTIAASNFTLSISIPANTTGSIYLPSTNLHNIRESGLAVTNAPGLFSYYFTNAPNWTNGATVFQMGSGTYRFNVTNINF